MTAARIFSVPFDSGRYRERMGRGPERLLNPEALDRLREDGCTFDVTQVAPRGAFTTEIATGFDLQGVIAMHVREARHTGVFPLVVSGNCNIAVGIVAGLRNPVGAPADGNAEDATDGASDDLGVLWLDAHADYNTPETTTTGFLDGMALAMLAGRCWRGMTGSVPGFRAIPENRIMLLGARDLDGAEMDLIDKSAITRISQAEVRGDGMETVMERAARTLHARGVRRLYMHIDLDVHDSAIAPANEFAQPNGLSPEEVRSAVKYARKRFILAAAALTAYDPAVDPEGKAMRIGEALLRALIEGGNNESDAAAR